MCAAEPVRDPHLHERGLAWHCSLFDNNWLQRRCLPPWTRARCSNVGNRRLFESHLALAPRVPLHCVVVLSLTALTTLAAAAPGWRDEKQRTSTARGTEKAADVLDGPPGDKCHTYTYLGLNTKRKAALDMRYALT